MVLVTGGTGLVGSNLLYFLSKKGYEIKAIKREKSNLKNVLNVFKKYDSINAVKYFNAIKWIDTDLFSIPKLLDALDGIDQVYHAAGCVSFKIKDHSELRKVNKHGTFNLVNVCLKKQVKSFCFISSVAVLCELDEQGYINEEFGTNQENNYYGYTKTAAEMDVWRAAEEGMNVVIVNPSIILGSGVKTESSAAFFEKQQLLKFYPNGGSGFIDVRDVANCCIELMEKEKFNARYILNAENKSYKDVFTLLRKEVNLSTPKKLPNWILDFYIIFIKIKSFFMWQGATMNASIYKNLKNQTNYNNNKIIEALDYNFTSVANSIQYHSQNKNNNS